MRFSHAITLCSKNLRKRKRVDLDRGCKFRAVITTIAKRPDEKAEPKYDVKMEVFSHTPAPGEFLYPDGHNHDTRRTADVSNVLVQNKRLLPEESVRVRELGGLGLKPREILWELGGSDAAGGRTRTTKTISNVLATERRRVYGSGDTTSVDIDLTVQFLLKCRTLFWLYCVTKEGTEVRLDERMFLQGSDVVEFCAGSTFKDLHVLFPGSLRVAAMYGDCVSVDSTHNMCSARFPLYLGMVGDTNGNL